MSPSAEIPDRGQRTPSGPSTLRAVAAAVVATAAGIFACGRIIVPQYAKWARGNVLPSPWSYESRFAAIRPHVPLDRAVGYVTNPTPDGRGGHFFDSRGYYLARYVLSPVHLVWETPAEFAIGDFHDDRLVADALNRSGYLVERDFGSGVMLLRRRDTR